MNFIKHIFCGLMLLLILNIDYSVGRSTDDDVQECGDSLAQYLRKVCVNGFNKKLRAKKSVSLNDIDDNNNDDNDDVFENDDQNPILSSLFKDTFYANYNNLMAKTRRRRYDGVADECCRKSCTMSELLSYCK